MKTVFVIGFFIASVSGTGVGQQERTTIDHDTLRGCLIATGDGFELATEGERLYKLVGSMAGLAKASGKEVSVRGKIGQSTSNHLYFAVAELQEVFTRRSPSISPTFVIKSAWHTKTNRTYGMRVSHPTGLADVAAWGENRSSINFVTAADIAVTIDAFRIPRSVFAGTNFVGGSFSIFVNPQIKSPQACSEFNYPSKTTPSSYRSGGVQYVVQKDAGVAAGTYSISEYYHTFQNGFCYELAFDLGEYNTSNNDLGCKIPRMRASDEAKVIQLLVAGISFVPPSVATAREDGRPLTPRMTELRPSSRIADSGANHGRIQISWSTEETDYVQFSYTCHPPEQKPGVMIWDTNSRDCENSRLHIV